ncbi:helix-turn-helix transcriptional regulator [Levilactobacillus tangyuanensis]|uniref:Helix-turn-helix transcriptional regulator n=1 Tax=Levilactobacillus tangyuanensis TaxID=2486021 RepID=A0ABW1TMH3_9LACO|nr:helix-turn-helix transcriptional regulator [Levilactobacillus tangyuanensis]
MNIDIFIETRRRLHLSQQQLAKGICTQATLSKFERRGQVPAIKILLQLCERLELTLNDLFPLDQGDDPTGTAALEQAEWRLLQGEFDQVKAQLAQVDHVERGTQTFQMRYFFIHGYVTALDGGSVTDALFDFSQILDRFDEGHHTLYALLAYAGTGIAYQQAGDNDRAGFYFQRVTEDLAEIKLRPRQGVWRILTVLYYTARFYGETGELDTSNDLLNRGVALCAEYHVTYYVARILYQRALNVRRQGGEPEAIHQDLRDAAAFARLNGNQKLLKKIAAIDHR